ncbi:RNA-directed DNA methylation 4 [Bienertia sinuspersici]
MGGCWWFVGVVVVGFESVVGFEWVAAGDLRCGWSGLVDKVVSRWLVVFGQGGPVCLPINSNGEKAVIVRVKRKADHSPLEAFWLEINERPAKRPLIDFQKLSLSSSPSPTREELKIKRVLVQHVETVGSSKASIQFLQSFVQPTSDGDSKFLASTKERRRTLQKENIHDQLLSKAKQEQEEIAKNARFEQLWKRRTRDKEASHDEALDEVCRVYDVLRVDEETSSMVKRQEEISVEDKVMLGKFLPLLREFVPGAAEDIESDICSHATRQDSADEYVYDLYAVNEKIDDTEASYPFPLVQVDDDDLYFDGLDDSDNETDDSNAENHPWNDYPDEESSEEEKSSKSGSESEEEEESEAETDTLTKSEDSVGDDRSEDRPHEDDMEMDGRHVTAYSDDGEERESEEVVVDIQHGIPQIPIDLFVKKNRKGVNFYDAFKNVRFKVGDALPHNHGLRGRFLLDSSGNSLVSIYRYHDGTWKGFKGDRCEELLFEAEQTLNTFSRTEFNVILTGENGANLTYAMKGCVFWRTCTIYQDKFIVAQTHLMYKLGFRKHFVGRSKFRVTVFPGFSDYNFIASLILVFLDGRKR